MKHDDKLIEMLTKSEALLNGHFLLSSGLHSDKYIQCAALTQYPKFCTYVAESLAHLYENSDIDVVIGGAYGGIILSFELGRVLNKRTIFAERVDGQFQLRRGFGIKKDERVLIAEDVCTTGKSILEVAKLVKDNKGIVVGCASIIDRCEKNGADLGIRKEYLQSIQANTYDEKSCLLCKELGSKPIKPGSRND